MIQLQMFNNLLILATLLSTLVAGITFTFAVIVMPGLSDLRARDYLNAFRAMDGMIQRNPPLFVLIWAGSMGALLIAALLGLRQLDGLPQWLMIAAAALALLGVHLPTMVVNVPLNNKLQALDLGQLDSDDLPAARRGFEQRWTRWNVIRTVAAVLVSAMLMLLLLII